VESSRRETHNSAKLSRQHLRALRVSDGNYEDAEDIKLQTLNPRLSMRNTFSRLVGAQQLQSGLPKRNNSILNASNLIASQPSPTRGSLFKLYHESVDEMLVRKLKAKYIESNAIFWLPKDDT